MIENSTRLHIEQFTQNPDKASSHNLDIPNLVITLTKGLEC